MRKKTLTSLLNLRKNKMEIKYLFPRSLGYYDSDDNYIEDITDDWSNSYQEENNDDYNQEALGHCCGAGLREPVLTRVNPKYGIDIFPGICGDGVSSERVQRAHVHTKNGDLTVAIRVSRWR